MRLYIIIIDIGNDVSVNSEITHRTTDYATHNERTFTVVEESSDEGEVNEDDIEKNQIIRSNLRKWAVEFNITHLALKDLLKIINARCKKILPEDPRTLLETPPRINITILNDGEYWHYGLGNCIKKIFWNLTEPKTISLNINFDGLPLFKSSKSEFWPILFNIAEMPQVPAMTIGIFSGKAKCISLESYLMPFVEELNEIMANGVHINSHEITVLIRCFVCDSPARAYVKGMQKYCNIVIPICISLIHFFYIIPQGWLITTVNTAA